MKYFFVGVVGFLTLLSCSKTAVNSISMQPDISHTASSAAAMGEEKINLSVYVEGVSYNDQCYVPDTVCTEKYFTTVTAELKGIIVKTTGTNIVENPLAMANLQTVLKNVSVKITAKSGSYFNIAFLHKPSKVSLQSRNLKFISANTYTGIRLKTTSKLSVSMLANAAKYPTAANVKTVLEELYNPTNFTVSFIE
jgi:hypothetical protein